MSDVSEFKKLACGCMVLVTGFTVLVIGYQEGCSTLEHLCEMKTLPPDNPHGPENDHRPGNAQVRMTVRIATSSMSAMPSMAFSSDLLKGLNSLALDQRPKLIE